jgi:hypothetical protein
MLLVQIILINFADKSPQKNFTNYLYEGYMIHVFIPLKNKLKTSD